MWFLNRRLGVWHHRPDGHHAGICGAALEAAEEIEEQEERPVGFDGLLCNRCWFGWELTRAREQAPDPFRAWLETVDFDALSESDTERLYAELGEERADSLLVIHSLAASSERPPAEPPAPVTRPEPIRANIAELGVIPLAIRQHTAAETAPAEPEIPRSAPVPEEPRIKVNLARRQPAQEGSSALSRLFRRLGGERA